MPHVTEIVLIVIIVCVVFGMGKLPAIASKVALLKTEFRKGLAGEPPVDVTPERPARAPGRKPGHFDQSVEDASVDKIVE